MKIVSLPDSCPLGVCHCHFLLEFLLPQSPLELVFQLLQFILGLLVKFLQFGSLCGYENKSKIGLFFGNSEYYFTRQVLDEEL